MVCVYGDVYLSTDNCIPIDIQKEAVRETLEKYFDEIFKKKVIEKYGSFDDNSDFCFRPSCGNGEIGRIHSGNNTLRLRGMTVHESFRSKFFNEFRTLHSQERDWLVCSLIPEEIYGSYPDKDRDRLESYICENKMRFCWRIIGGKRVAAIIVLAHG